MANTKYNPEHERVLNTMLGDVPVAKPGKMFGYPAYKPMVRFSKAKIER